MTTITFKFGMPEQLTLFSDSPDAGDPECVCSLCGAIIEEDEFPLRIFLKDDEKYPDGAEYRLHQDCSHQVIEWGWR